MPVRSYPEIADGGITMPRLNRLLAFSLLPLCSQASACLLAVHSTATSGASLTSRQLGCAVGSLENHTRS